MFRLLKSSGFFLLALLFLILAVFAFRAMSPWFWVLAAAAVFFCICGLGIVWVVRTVIWFGVFWGVKLWIGPSGMVGSFVAFTAATIAARLTGRIYWTIRRRRWENNRRQMFAGFPPSSLLDHRQ